MTASSKDTGISVNHEVSISRAEGSHEAHTESTLPLRPRVRRLSDSSSILSDIFRHPDVHEETLRCKIRQTNEQHSPKDLVDFFRNTAPPPHNIMSIPDSYDSNSSSEDSHGWKLGSLKTFRKKKKKKKIKQARRPRPKSITLPDTAVAGTTIGGHRYIAISIPIEHAHLDYGQGKKGRSVYKPTGAPANWSPPPAEQFIETRTGPVRLNTDPRVVTVLKPVVEARESMETLMQVSMMAEEALAKGETPALPDSPTRTLNEKLATNPAPLKVETPDIEETRPKTADTLSGRGAASPSPRPGVFQHVQRTSLPNSQVRIYCPQRRSSLGHGTAENRGSFEAPSVRRHRRGLSSESNAVTANRLSIAESIMTNGSEPVIVDATTARGYEVSANRYSVLTNAETIVYAPVITTPRRRAVSAADTWSPAAEESDASRDLRTHGRTASDQGNAPSPKGTAVAPRAFSLTRSGSLKKTRPTVQIPIRPMHQDSPGRVDTPRSEVETLVTTLKRPSTSEGLSLVPFMVVAEVQPSSLPASPLPASPPPSRGGILHEAPTYDSLHSSAATVIKLASRPSLASLGPLSPPQPASSGPTPPDSPQRTDEESLPPPIPPRERPLSRSTVSLDRISLSRRREWAAERQRDRESRVRAQTAARKVIHAETQTVSPRLSRGPRTDSHQELARRFDVLRDARDRDLETRLSRLEQNGDTWLSTMVPLFEKLNESLTRLSETDDGVRRGGREHELPSWEGLKRDEIAQEYRLREERDRRRMMKRQAAQNREDGERPESRRGRTSHHRSSRRESRPQEYEYDHEPDHRLSMTTTKSRHSRRSTVVRPSLQEDLESEFARRQLLEHLNAAVDARISELSGQGRRGSTHALVAEHRSQQPSQSTSVDLDGIVDDNNADVAGIPNGLNSMEPLIRELIGGSRLHLENEKSSNSGEPEARVQYMLEQF